jgi:hypothetical protein
VRFYSPNLGKIAGALAQEGFSFVDFKNSQFVPDVAHVQHASTAYYLRGHLPKTPMVFVSHSYVFDIGDVPYVANPQAVVVLNDRVKQRVESSAWGEKGQIFRLHQPIDIPFTDSGLVPLPDRPTRAALINPRNAPIAEALKQACQKFDIELLIAGNLSSLSDDLTPLMMQSDIVFGVGRTLLEAAALGRAGFVIDDRGSSGFLTEENYAAFEANSFVAFDPHPISVNQLVSQLEGYRSTLGRVGRELIRKTHDPRRHAESLVECYRSVMNASPPTGITVGALSQLASAQAEEIFSIRQHLRHEKWMAASALRQRDEAQERASILEGERNIFAARLSLFYRLPFVRLALRVRGWVRTRNKV